MAVPLSQLAAVDPDDSTAEAIADWHYWVAQSYCLLLTYAGQPKAHVASANQPRRSWPARSCQLGVLSDRPSLSPRVRLRSVRGQDGRVRKARTAEVTGLRSQT
ncbi:MAG: calcium-binding protein [Bryobacteraceae bacterium]